MPETADRDLDLVRTSVRELAGRFDLGYWRQRDKQAEYPWAFVKAFADAFDRYNTDAHSIGQGALDSYLTAMGVRFGLESKKEAQAGTAAVKGEFVSVGARPRAVVSASELAEEMARSAGG